MKTNKKDLNQLSEEIDKFFQYMRSQKDKIMQQQEEEHKRILLLCLLDTLSCAAFPSEERNKGRFVRLIDDYFDWEDKDRISLPQLQHLLNETLHDKYRELKREVNNRLGNWKKGHFYRVSDHDPKIGEFSAFNKPDERTMLKKVRHAELIWVFRNFLIHESRSPGYGVSLSNDNSTPYYLSMSISNSESYTWELVYHSQFIAVITDKIISNLRDDFANWSINPYDSFKFGSNWFKK